MAFSSFGYVCSVCFFFFFKQKTAYEMRISDWSSDVCSSDLVNPMRPSDRRHEPSAGLVADLLAAAKAGLASLEGERDSLLECACNQIGRASCRDRVCQYV